MAEATEVSITYVENSTGLTKTVTSSLKTDIENNIEISNDGIDNDGDGLIDCKDPALTDCEYITEADAGYPTTITNVFQTISFSKVMGQDGTLLTGNWWASDSVALSFYVESFTAGTTVNIQYIGPANSTTINLVNGWNVAKITLGGPEFLLASDIQDFLIKSNGPNFTISTTETPTVFLTINP